MARRDRARFFGVHSSAPSAAVESDIEGFPSSTFKIDRGDEELEGFPSDVGSRGRLLTA
jgi:hypothetical protein